MIYKQFFLFTCQMTQTRLIYYSCAFWSLTFRCILIEPYISFDYNYQNDVFYKAQHNYIKCYV